MKSREIRVQDHVFVLLAFFTFVGLLQVLRVILRVILLGVVIRAIEPADVQQWFL